ncbi:hypothetical protein SAMN06265173_11044 [Thalassovita litoralis]|jgi:hypothetical protein|uniref:DUF1150 domain-containing protein n=1 Tax=Thalassovita litoralis TaxID=1010611 RepID=A0A521DD80_9RHOB|nr:DUF1150 family protein [Thalassovita litoralis]SMO69555.1 hypothetical protein SAMN06265173_11044 [Thalassovita litoralis]
MNTKYDFGQDGEQRIVYVRPVKVADLPEELRKQAGDLTELYAVHNAEGERLALVNDRKLAFLLARQHDLAPVTVH